MFKNLKRIQIDSIWMVLKIFRFENLRYLRPKLCEQLPGPSVAFLNILNKPLPVENMGSLFIAVCFPANAQVEQKLTNDRFWYFARNFDTFGLNSYSFDIVDVYEIYLI